MTDEYRQLQPVADFFHIGKKKVKKVEAKPDTRWHDEMVKEANESFSKPKKEPMLGGKKNAAKGKSSMKKRKRK